MSTLSCARFELVHTGESFHCRLQASLKLITNFLLRSNLIEEISMVSAQMIEPKSLKAEDFLLRDLVEISTSSCPKREDNLGRLHWHELLLLEELGKNSTS